jgi:hypothetical protein
MALRLTRGIVDGLRQNPLALALVVVNVLFLVGALLVLRTVADAIVAERAERAALLRDCLEQLRLP